MRWLVAAAFSRNTCSLIREPLDREPVRICFVEKQPLAHSRSDTLAEKPSPDAMNDPEVMRRIKAILDSPSYRLAYHDHDFISRPDLRPLRLELELLKPEMLLEEQGINSTVVVFGGTQILERSHGEHLLKEAEELLAEEPNDEQLQRDLARTKRIVAKSKFYDECREFCRVVSSYRLSNGVGQYVVVTGGGPGIMEAGNRGAADANAKSVGLNITLPFEQVPNAYITPELCFQFNYFALRKMHFMFRAKALVCFPGGFGTLDELFTTLTLRQTQRMQVIPIILYGTDYWRSCLNLEFLADEGVIKDRDLELFDFADSPEEAWKLIADFHGHGTGTE